MISGFFNASTLWRRNIRIRHAALAVALLAVALSSVAIYYRQNYAGAMGGPISVEKTLWLAYAVAAWYVLPAYVVTDGRFSWVLRKILLAHLVSMSVRGAVELWMLYVTASWSPVYGISHDVFNAGILLALSIMSRRDLRNLTSSQDRVVGVFIAVVIIGMLVEAGFAGMFYRAIAGEAETLYFAAASDQFGFINRITVGVVVLAYAHFVLMIRTLLGARQNVDLQPSSATANRGLFEEPRA